MKSLFKFSKVKDEEGGSLVEMGLCCIVLMPMLFGVIQFSMALYAYHFVSYAAREGSRYAMVRGSLSCTNTPNLSNACSSTSGATSANIQTWVQGLGYPLANKLTVSTTWYSYSADVNGHATWALCASQCSVPGNQVKVTVTDRFPLAVPYWKSLTIPIRSSATMVISQ
jgi:Flp pilus assembly protein TadG